MKIIPAYFFLIIIIVSSCQNHYSDTDTLELIDLEKSLRTSNKLIARTNENLVQKLELDCKTKIIYRPLLEKAKDFLAASEGLDRLIGQLKKSLFSKTGGSYPNPETITDSQILIEKTLKKGQNTTIVEELFLSNNFQGIAQEPQAKVLDKAIQALENRWVQLLESCWENGGIPSSIFIKQAKKDSVLSYLQQHLILPSSKNYTLKTPKTWTEFNFKDQNFAATILNLTSIQNEVKLFESVIVNFLTKQTSYGDLVFDKFTIFTQSPNGNIRLGETYSTEISLGIYVSKIIMDIAIDGNILQTVDGIAQYSVRPNKLGPQKYRPLFTLTNPLTGEKETFRKEFHFDVLP